MKHGEIYGEAKPLVVSMGEPASIAAEITLRAFTLRHQLHPQWQVPIAPFFVIGNLELFRATAKRLDMAVDCCEISAPFEAIAAFSHGLPVINQPLAATVVAGQLDSRNSAAVIASLERSVAFIHDNQAAALITNPIHKGLLQQSGFGHSGHTEFLGELSRNHGFANAEAVMMLVTHRVAPPLRVVPITVHLSLKAAIAALTLEKIVKTAVIVHESLKQQFGIATPRLAIAGLNPHAGEGGLMGDEEITIIAPAIAKLQAMGMEVSGAHSADSLFHAAARQGYDAVLCPTHDQALIPIKTLDFDGGVNLTLGLDFIRTSPDHGTALDIAAVGGANPSSLIESLHLAQYLALHRQSESQSLSQLRLPNSK